MVASGFTLIFGLMRVVNMAHGSLYLLGGYLALQMQDSWFKEQSGWASRSAATGDASYSLLELDRPAAAGDADHRPDRRGVQQVFLRWNQGQDLRQALITIALSVIFADQMLAAFGGISKDIKAPTGWPDSIALPGDVRFGFFRGVVVLGAAILIGLALWWLIKRTRFGKIVRAGVDDRDMVAALGINVQLVFAAAFFIGALLAGFGGVLGGTMIALAPGEDTSFLLNSLIVVIIGGMGSLGGAAIGALALGPRGRLRRRLPDLRRHQPDELLDHRHVRPARRRPRRPAARPVREARMTRDRRAGTHGLGRARAIAVLLAVLAPLVFTEFFVSVILTKSLWLGVAAASLIFLSAFGGMVSLAQVGIYGVAGMTFAEPRRRRRRQQRRLGALARGAGRDPRRRRASGWSSARSPRGASASTS